MRMGRRPILSRAAMSEPSRFMMMRVTEPSIISCACRMPSTRDSFWLMSAAISSVELTSPRAHRHELPLVAVQAAADELVGVVDGVHGGDGVRAQLRAHEQGLGVLVADAADGARAVEVLDVALEARAERGVLNGVDLALEAAVVVEYDHACPARPQMRVIVNAKELVQHHVSVGCHAKESAHVRSFRTVVQRPCSLRPAGPAAARAAWPKGRAR